MPGREVFYDRGEAECLKKIGKTARFEDFPMIDLRPAAARLAAFAVTLLACAGVSVGQEKKAYEKHDQAALNQSLKDVINAGARMYNDHGDHAGCFRLYQGSLIAVRPFLTADLQKKIDAAVFKCEGLASYSERAFELRKVLDEIREKTKPASEPIVEKKKDEKGNLAGRVTYQGKPQLGGYFITLLSSDNKKYSSALQKDGSFSFQTPIPVGEYRVAIEPIPGEKLQGKIPARYHTENTSGLSIRVQPGKQNIELNLVN